MASQLEKIFAMFAFLALSASAASAVVFPQSFPPTMALGSMNPCIQYCMLQQAFAIGGSPIASMIMQHQPLAQLLQQQQCNCAAVWQIIQHQMAMQLPSMLNPVAMAMQTPSMLNQVAMAMQLPSMFNPVAMAMQTPSMLNQVAIAMQLPSIFNPVAMAMQFPYMFNPVTMASPAAYCQQPLASGVFC